jgi:hypothetical protein
MAGLCAAVGGVPATLVSAREALDRLMRSKTELVMLYCVLSADDGSRWRFGVPARMGVAGLTARGSREPDGRERNWKPTCSRFGLAGGFAPGDGEGEGMRESRRTAGVNAVLAATAAAAVCE